MARTKRGLPDMTWIPDKKLWRKRGTYKGQKYSITAKEPEDVITKIEAFKAQIDSGIIDDDTTLFQYVQRWYPLRVAGLRPKSIDVYRNALDCHILPRLGNLPLKDIKPIHIDELMAGLECKSNSMHSKILSTMKQIFDSAIDNDLLAKNPCTRKKAGGEKAKKKTPLTQEQQQTFVEAVKYTRAELFTLLCLYAGLRREEALGLLWSNVYLDNSTPYLDVRHTVTYDRNGHPTHAETLKTNAAYRTIPLPLQLSDALRRWRGKTNSEFVIPAEQSKKEMSLVAFRRMWDIAVKRIDFHVEPHILRHTYITRLCASGMDIKKIQYLAGHAKVQMTLDIYACVNREPTESSNIFTLFSLRPSKRSQSPSHRGQEPCQSTDQQFPGPAFQSSGAV